MRKFKGKYLDFKALPRKNCSKYCDSYLILVADSCHYFIDQRTVGHYKWDEVGRSGE